MDRYKKGFINTNKTVDFLIYGIFFSLWIFNYYIRGAIASGPIQNINIISTLFITTILFLKIKLINKSDFKLLWIVLIISFLFIITQVSVKSSFNITIIYYLCIIFPLFLLTISIKIEYIDKNFKNFLITLNIFTIILLTMGIIDMLSDKSVTKIFVDIFNNEKFSEFALASHMKNRYFSFMGHPLYNKSLFIIFFTFNMINNIYFEKIIPNTIIILISAVGIALTGSKVGFILLFVGLIIMGFKNIKTFIIQIIIGAMLLNTGIFNSTIERFQGSITSNRNEYWEIVDYFNYYPIKFKSGYGADFTFRYNEILKGASAAFEYPFRLFSLEYGILFTIFFYILFISIICILIKRRHLYLLIGYCLIFIDFNTYNTIGLPQDGMTMLCISIMYIKNISNFIYSKDYIKQKVGE